jgi:hypothetical protein
VGDESNIPKYPAAYVKIDLGIVPGSQQSTEISNWFQDEIIAMINRSLPEAKVGAKMPGVSYHRKLFRGQYVYVIYGTREECNGTRDSGKHATRLRDSDGDVGGIQCSEGNGWYGERAEGIQGDDGEDCGGTALVERQAISWAQILWDAHKDIFKSIADDEYMYGLTGWAAATPEQHEGRQQAHTDAKAKCVHERGGSGESIAGRGEFRGQHANAEME